MQPTDTQLVFGGPVPPRAGTQQRQILDMMRHRRWVCGAEFAREVTWAFGARLSELRARGFHVSKRACRNPRHRHKSQLWEYAVEIQGGPHESCT